MGMEKSVLFNKFPILETKRLLLTYFHEEHVFNLFQQLNDPDVIEMVNDGKTFTMDEVHASITQHYPSLYQTGEALVWAIILKETGDLVGMRQCFVDTKPVTVQGWIDKQHRRMGYTIEAYAVIIDLLKKANVKLIKANCEKHNNKAINMLQKIGFEKEEVSDLAMLINPMLKYRSGISFFMII